MTGQQWNKVCKQGGCTERHKTKFIKVTKVVAMGDMLILGGLNKMADILQMTILNAFSWIKMLEFRIEFPLNEFSWPWLMISQISAWCQRGGKPLLEPMMTKLLDNQMVIIRDMMTKLLDNQMVIIKDSFLFFAQSKLRLCSANHRVVSWALQDVLSKFVYCRNLISYENFKLKLCTCAQSHALGTRTMFQLEILTGNVISAIVYFREIILESSRNVCETTPRPQWVKYWSAVRSHEISAAILNNVWSEITYSRYLMAKNSLEIHV